MSPSISVRASPSCGPPQCERILVARRLHADREDAGQRVEAFRDREHAADVATSDRITRKARLIELIERRGDLGVLAARVRVVAAHDALQLGKLADHARHQIALRQRRCARREGGIDAHTIRDHARELGDAHAFVPDAAERLLIRDRFQRALVRSERLFLVLIEKEFRIGEARADHALVAFADLEAGSRESMFATPMKSFGELVLAPSNTGKNF